MPTPSEYKTVQARILAYAGGLRNDVPGAAAAVGRSEWFGSLFI